MRGQRDKREQGEKREGPDFSVLLQAAVSEPGIVSEAYSAFHSYSLGNQLAALFQCRARGVQVGPLSTFPGWKEKGRHVKRGERALVLCMPVTAKRTERDQASGEEREHVFTRFVWRANWFTVYQTDGEPFQAPEPVKAWDRARALEALGITEEPFSMADGNCQGYAKGRSIAVSPVAALPHKTCFHELAHVVLGHTSESSLSDTGSITPRDVREVEAEGVAFLLCATLELPGLAESRGYLQSWLHGGAITERSAQRIYSAANAILSAGKDGASC
jgi:antirestriction protein ArdC